MKKTIQLMIAGALVLGAVSCAKEIASEENSQPSGPVTLTATIVDESGTKATLNDVTGAFAFSGTDAIKVYNGSACYKSTGVSIEGGVATFTMADGFTNSGSGFAAFPADFVSDITASGVTFILPTTYDYSEVGGPDPDAAMVHCPMMATYTGGNTLQFKQVGSVVRVRVTNIAAGTLSFTFPTSITGRATVATTPSGTGDGITTLNYEYGNTITVRNVPAVLDGSYIYITLPVPTNTKPQGILVINNPANASASRLAAITGDATALNRAGGYKLSVKPLEAATPSFKVGPTTTVVLAPGNLMAHVASYEGGATATADSWRFGGYFEKVGRATNAGNYLFANGISFTDKWIDLLSWQGASATIKAHGLVNSTNNEDYEDYYGKVASESLYDGCWNTGSGGITIANGGEYTWRPMSFEEWDYLLNNDARGAVVNENNKSRFARATVAGVNGLLIFPDSSNEIWNESTMGTPPENINDGVIYQGWGSANNYSAANFVAIYNAGIVFIPVAGSRNGSGVSDIDSTAYYWTSSAYNKTQSYYMYVHPNYVLSGNVGARHLGRSVRLVRDLPAE